VLVYGHQGPVLFSGVFIAEEVDRVEGKGSGYTQTLLEAVFSNVPLISLLSLVKAWGWGGGGEGLGRMQYLFLGLMTTGGRGYEYFRFFGLRIEGIFLYL
jgi:hypothetical protein